MARPITQLDTVLIYLTKPCKVIVVVIIPCLADTNTTDLLVRAELITGGKAFHFLDDSTRLLR